MKVMIPGQWRIMYSEDTDKPSDTLSEAMARNMTDEELSRYTEDSTVVKEIVNRFVASRVSLVELEELSIELESENKQLMLEVEDLKAELEELRDE